MKMESKPYNQWINLYSTDIEYVWYSQCTELRNAAMLLKALENECKRIYNSAEELFKSCEDKIRKKLLFDEKENLSGNHTLDLSSPEIFSSSCNDLTVSTSNNNEENNTDSFQDNLNTNSVSPKLDRIGKISRSRRLKRCSALNYSSLAYQTAPKNKLQKDIIDSTLVEITPDISDIAKKGRLSKCGNKNKAKLELNKKSTLKTLCASDMNVDDDHTEVKYGNVISSPVCVSKQDKVIKEDVFVFKETPVRGKARLQLEGWDCVECKKFYDELALNTQETKKLLNKCSKHRSKFKPQNFTPKGFWDLHFPDSPEPPDKDQSTYFQY